VLVSHSILTTADKGSS